MASKYPMFTADHTGAASSSLVYEKYESTEGNVFKDDAIDVKSYIQIRHAVAMAPNSAEAEGKMEIPGEIVNSKAYRTATETGKKIGRTILKGMRKSELAGLCYTDFSIADVFVSTSGKAKLKGVRRIKFCMTQQFNNYGAVCAIMTELFTLNGQIPAEIQRLINLMRTRFDLRFMYHLHGSLVPIARSTLLYKTLYEQLEISTMDKARKDVILLGLPLLSQWKGLVATNWLLKCTFDHKQKEYNDGLGRYTRPPLPLWRLTVQRRRVKWRFQVKLLTVRPTGLLQKLGRKLVEQFSKECGRVSLLVCVTLISALQTFLSVRLERPS